eukprot:INCI1321.1.p1 GENE.INCI1321.1~~INCI1321.1.p1  ORF type:complete len:500 (+),score=47.09 INCI1321.1:73-1500(+)
MDALSLKSTIGSLLVVVLASCANCWHVSSLEYAGTDDEMLVGAHYFAGWSRNCVFPNGSAIPSCYSHFHGFTPTGQAVDDFFPAYPSRIPLLGNLTTDVETVAREIKVADSVLDFFDVLYYDGGADCGMPDEPDADPGLRWCLDSTLAFLLNSSFIWENTTQRLHFYITYSNDVDAHSPGAFVGPVGLAKWDALVHTWVDAMTHQRYLKINGRPIFKVLIPEIFLQVECNNNETLATALLDRLRAAATAKGLQVPLIGGGWQNPSVPAIAPVPVPTGYQRYGDVFVDCPGGCAISSAILPGSNSTTACEHLCNTTSGCQAIQVSNAAAQNETNCTLLNAAAPGAPMPGTDTYVRKPGDVFYDFTGTYNAAPPVCPDQPNWQCARYNNSWMPNATASGGKVFPYEECGVYQGIARMNHTGDDVPYVPNVIAGFDPRPWEEHSPSFSMPNQTEWETSLQQVCHLRFACTFRSCATYI